MAAEPIYKVIFINQNQVFELFARQIYQSDLYGFIEVEDYIFGERSQIVVDPAEERVRGGKAQLYPDARDRAYRRGRERGLGAHSRCQEQ